MSKTNVLALIETALVAALAMALSYIPDFASWFTPSFGAVPLVVFALRRGTKYGTLAGLIWGLLHFVLGKVYYLALSQVLIEYIVAFVSMGAAGLVSRRFQQALKKGHTSAALSQGLLGAFLGVFIRYIWHFIAGVIFWGSYAKGMSPYWYSFTVNGIAGLSTLVIVLIALAILIKAQPNFFQP